MTVKRGKFYMCVRVCVQVRAKGIPAYGGASEAFKNMALSSVKGRVRPGMVLPNLARCNRQYLPPPNSDTFGTTKVLFLF